MLTSPDNSALLLAAGRRTAYLAAPGFVAELLAELGDWVAVHDRLVIAEGPPRPVAWAQNIWVAPEEIAIGSIGDAAKAPGESEQEAARGQPQGGELAALGAAAELADLAPVAHRLKLVRITRPGCRASAQPAPM